MMSQGSTKGHRETELEKFITWRSKAEAEREAGPQAQPLLESVGGVFGVPS